MMRPRIASTLTLDGLDWTGLVSKDNSSDPMSVSWHWPVHIRVGYEVTSNCFASVCELGVQDTMTCMSRQSATSTISLMNV